MTAHPVRAVGGLALLLLASCVPIPAVPAPPPRAPAPAAYPDLEHRAHELVNRYRASRGLDPLDYDERVASVARGHSEAMASGRSDFSHDGFDARARRVSSLLPMRSMAENIAYDSRSRTVVAREVVQGWIDSAPHRRNIEGDFDIAGIGVARAPNGFYYFTQILVGTR